MDCCEILHGDGMIHRIASVVSLEMRFVIPARASVTMVVEGLSSSHSGLSLNDDVGCNATRRRTIYTARMILSRYFILYLPLQNAHYALICTFRWCAVRCSGASRLSLALFVAFRF